jgi:hypothetical protein
MTDESARAQQFEVLLGRPLGNHDNVVVVRERMSVWTLAREGWIAVSREIGTTGDATKACGDTAVVDVGGIAVTDANGVARFLLTDFLCPVSAVFPEFSGPITLVATTQSDQPIFLTSLQRIVTGSSTNDVTPINDVEITVFSWRVPGGRAEPTVSFDWRCVVPVRLRPKSG